MLLVDFNLHAIVYFCLTISRSAFFHIVARIIPPSLKRLYISFQTCLQYVECLDLCNFRNCRVEIEHNVLCLIINNCVPKSTTQSPTTTVAPTSDFPSPWWLIMFFFIGSATTLLCTFAGFFMGKNVSLYNYRKYSIFDTIMSLSLSFHSYSK